ncbi:MAG: ParB/RepB/Spo0J family partition protein [Bacteroidota bacterium]
MPKKLNPSRKPTKAKLGSGLDALLGGKRLEEAMQEAPAETVAALSKDFSYLPVAKINRNPDQPRVDFEMEALEDLANSIKVHGIIQPMTVRHMGDGTYQIISGERRFRASQMAGLQEVPAFIRTADDQTLLEMALIENIQREDLNPMEVAYSYFRLKEDFNMTQAEVADRVGKKRPTVTGYLGILETSPKVQQAVRDKKISVGAAKTFRNIKDIGLQELFLEEILANEDWSVRTIEDKARGYKAKQKSAKTKTKSTKNDDLTTVKKALQDFFSTKQVTVKADGKEATSGTITIKYADQEHLEFIYKAVE